MSRLHGLLSYLLSLHAAAHALLAVAPQDILPVAVGLALALLVGDMIHSRLGKFRELRLRVRVLAAVWFVYGSALFLALIAVKEGDPALLQVATRTLVVFQAGYLLFAGGGRGYLGVHQNALALVCLAGVAGGLIASAAFAGYAALVVLWLVLDNHARKKAPAGVAWGAALPLALLTGATLGGLFTLVAPRPYEPLTLPRVVVVDRAQLEAIYRELLTMLIGVLATGVVLFLLLRWLRRRVPSRLSLPEEAVEVEARRGPIQRRQRGRRAGRMDWRGWRARVVRLYLSFLGRASRFGLVRKGAQTPAEFAADLPAPADRLTGIFMRARYGPRDVSEADFREADWARKAVLEELRRSVS